ncbi:LPXTG cell wall anchor domain-containing protein [Leifsonia sp. NCR5]|uniref:LPXTG cell wall anchor domain-containing protein n=1 Tax=Leifsonia sp. NCR5 TaxID=1978342 RepID=UPI0015C46533|nr:LPXTG cell wall anchor domain-containing protein [Leifsonia sp. NCR5]
MRIPDDVPPGPYDLGMLCALDDMVFGGTAEDIRFTVLTPETPTPDPSPTPTAPIVHADDRPATTGGATDELAATGASTSTAAIAATALAAAGLSALLMHRRRSRRNS